MKKQFLTVRVAVLLGCMSCISPIQAEPKSSLETQTFPLRDDFNATDFKAALIGKWESVYAYQGTANIKTISLSADGQAILIVNRLESNQKQYSGSYTISFERKPEAGSVTFATITIEGKGSEPITLARVNFGLHSGLHQSNGMLLRIDGNPKGVMVKKN